MTITSKTLEYLREICPLVWKTEYSTNYGGKFLRHDLLNFGDILAVYPDRVELWQSTSTGNMSVRVKKILGLETARQWLQHPHRKIFVIGWKKYATPVDRKYWRPTIREITINDYDG